KSLGGETGVRVGRGGRVEDLGKENVGNVLVNGNLVGCSYKEFLACNPKEYDGIGGVVVLTRWIKKMKNVQDMSGCSIDQKVKYTAGSFLEFCPSHEMQKLETELWNHAMVGAGHATYTDRFHELARLFPHLVTLESQKIKRYVYGLAPQIRVMVAATEPKTMQKAVQISCALTYEAVRNGSIKKVEKRGNMEDPSKDKNGRDDNKRTKTGNAFAATINHVGRENAGRLAQIGVPRNVNLVNARNPPVRACYECGIEPSELGFIYKIEIASGQLVEIDKIIKGCRLEIDGHVFDIDLISFGHGSFDVIIDWLSNHKADIICHEKVVRIPLLDGKNLEEIVVVRDLTKVFPNDLYGLLPVRKIMFQIKLIQGAMPVAKSPYRLAPSKLEELSGQLKDGSFRKKIVLLGCVLTIEN
nr:reverse transcriptase domain-containing protein [Tanacetum cinerariifolium]